MSQISIVGLGPGSFGQLTVETLELLQNENKNYFRTAVHPVVKELEKRGIEYCSFDVLYEDCECFEDVYESIAEQLVKSRGRSAANLCGSWKSIVWRTKCD